MSRHIVLARKSFGMHVSQGFTCSVTIADILQQVEGMHACWDRMRSEPSRTCHVSPRHVVCWVCSTMHMNGARPYSKVIDRVRWD